MFAWYKFVLTDNRYTVLNRIEFIGVHILVLLTVFFIVITLMNIESNTWFVGYAMITLLPLVADIRHFYRTYTLSFEQKMLQGKPLTAKQKELFKTKEELMDRVERDRKIL